MDDEVYLALKSGDIAAFKQLLEKNPLILKQVAKDEMTPLLVAVDHYQVAMASYLLENGYSKITERDKEQFTPLLLAAFRGNVEMIQLLLKHGARLNERGSREGDNALSLAAWDAPYEVVTFLLKEGAYINLLLNNGRTILQHLLAEKRNSGVIPQLQAATTLLEIAEHKTKAEADESLLKNLNGALNARTNEGNTAFLLSAEKGNIELLKLLLKNQCNPKIRNDLDETALLLASRAGQLNTIQFLLKEGCAQVTERDSYGNSALLIAAEAGKINVVTYLLEMNLASINERNQQGKTALLLAAANGHVDVVHFLLRKGANLKERDTAQFGDHCLYLAAMNKHINVVKLLLKSGAYLDLLPKNNMTTVEAFGTTPTIGPLLNAADKLLNLAEVDSKDETQALSLIGTLEGSLVNARRTKTGNTALHTGLLNNNIKLALLLVQRGANVLLENEKRETPLELAHHSKNAYLLSLMHISKIQQFFEAHKHILTIGDTERKETKERKELHESTSLYESIKTIKNFLEKSRESEPNSRIETKVETKNDLKSNNDVAQKAETLNPEILSPKEILEISYKLAEILFEHRSLIPEFQTIYDLSKMFASDKEKSKQAHMMLYKVLTSDQIIVKQTGMEEAFSIFPKDGTLEETKDDRNIRLKNALLHFLKCDAYDDKTFSELIHIFIDSDTDHPIEGITGHNTASYMALIDYIKNFIDKTNALTEDNKKLSELIKSEQQKFEQMLKKQAEDLASIEAQSKKIQDENDEAERKLQEELQRLQDELATLESDSSTQTSSLLTQYSLNQQAGATHSSSKTSETQKLN